MFVMKYKYLYEINTVMCTRGVIVKQETKRNKQKGNKIKQKRNETKRHNRNETKPKKSSINKKTKQTLTK